jgi:hypothetical protein
LHVFRLSAIGNVPGFVLVLLRLDSLGSGIQEEHLHLLVSDKGSQSEISSTYDLNNFAFEAA